MINNMLRKLTIIKLLLFSVVLAYGQAGLMVNEISQGSSGKKEFVELVVVGPACTSVDLRGWIVDDNNGDFITCAGDNNGALAGSGIAAGHIRFSINDVWREVPVGTIILLYAYNPSDVGEQAELSTIGLDYTDGNCDYVRLLPINSSNTLLEKSVSLPMPSSAGSSMANRICPNGVNGNPAYGTTTYQALTDASFAGLGANEGVIGLRNGGDAFQTRYPDGSYFHGISYGTASGADGVTPILDGGPDNLKITNSGGSNKVYYFNEGNYRAVNQYSVGTAMDLQTPGTANNCLNANWIESLRSLPEYEFNQGENCPNVANTTNLCVGETSTFSLTGNCFSDSYTWSVADENIINIIGNTNNPSINIEAVTTGSTIISVTATNTYTDLFNGLSCTPTPKSMTYNFPITIKDINADFDIMNSSPCEGGMITVSSTAFPINDANTTYSWTVTGAENLTHTGEPWTFPTNQSGSYIIELVVENPSTNCTNTLTQNITIDPINEVNITQENISIYQTINNVNLDDYITNNNGNWIDENNTSITTFTTDNSGTFEVYYTNGSGDCNDTDTLRIEVIELGDASLADIPNNQLCNNAGEDNIQTIDLNGIVLGDTTGIWEYSPLVPDMNPLTTINGITTFNANGLPANTYGLSYTVLGTEPCPDLTSLANIEVAFCPPNCIENADLQPSPNLCSGDIFNLNDLWIPNVTTPTGTWSLDAPIENLLNDSLLITDNLSGEYTLTYTVVSNIIGCPTISESQPLTITPLPNSDIHPFPSNLCTSDASFLLTDLFTTATTPNGNWTIEPPLTTIEDNVLTLTDLPANTYEITYTVAAIAPCTSVAQSSQNIVIEELVSITDLPKIVCGLTTNITTSLSNNGSWTVTEQPTTAQNQILSTPIQPSTTITVDAYGTYVFTWTTNQEACANRENIVITFSQQPASPIVNNVTICAGSSPPILATLANSNNQLNWSGSEIGVGSVFIPTSTEIGNYTYEVWEVSTNNCESDKVPVTLDIADCTCPIISNFPTNQSVCSGTEVTLAATIEDSNNNLAKVAWVNELGELVGNDLTINVLKEITACDVQTFTYQFNSYCTKDTNIINEQKIIALTYYPVPSLENITINYAPDSCTINITSDCPNFTQETFTTNINGDNTTVDFTVSNLAASSIGLNCALTSNTNFSCHIKECPSITNINENISLCSNEQAVLVADIVDNDNQLAKVEWVDGIGNVVATSSQYFFSNTVNSCESISFQYTLNIYCAENPSLVYESAVVNITVFPVFDDSFLTFTEDCNNQQAPSLISNCPNYILTPIEVNEPIDGNNEASWEITYATTNCFSEIVTYEYACDFPVCPFIAVDNEDIVACSGSSILLQASIIDPDNQLHHIDWLDDNGVLIGVDLAINTIAPINTSCEPMEYIYTVLLYCDDNEAIPFMEKTITVLVYPIPTLEHVAINTVNNGCTIEVNSLCNNFSITGQQTFTTNTNGDQSTVTFLVNNTQANNQGLTCNQSFETSFDCQVTNCPAIESVTNNISVCSNESIDLLVNINDVDNKLLRLEWIDESGNLVSTNNTYSFQESNTGCDPLVLKYQVSIYCTDNPLVIQDSRTISITIYPEFNESFFTLISTCESVPFLSTSCFNYTIAPITVPEPTSGLNETYWQITYNNEFGCVDSTVQFNYICDEISCPTLTNISDDVSICGEQNILLSATISDENNSLERMEWLDESGAIISTDSMVSIIPTLATCNTLKHTYTFQAYCITDPNFPIITQEVTITNYAEPHLDLLTINHIDNGCTVSLVSDCPNFAVQGEESISTLIDNDQSEVAFTVVNIAAMTANLNCALTITDNFNCLINDCPTINSVTQNQSICSGESLPLSVNFTDDDNQLASIQWLDDESNVVNTTPTYVFNKTINICESEVFNYTVNLYCLDNPNIVFETRMLTITVYPSLNEDLLTFSTDCENIPTLQSPCDNYLINPITVSAPTTGINQTTWQVTYNNEVGCINDTLNFTYNCGETACPDILASTSNTTICNESVAPLSVIINDAANTLHRIEWLDRTGNRVSNTSTYSPSFSIQGCDKQVFTYTFNIYCTNDTTVIWQSRNIDITVLPDIDLSFIETTTEECSLPSLTSTCDNYVVTPLAVPTEIISGDNGLAIWSVSYPDNLCATELIEVPYNCPIACPTIAITNTLPASLCHLDIVTLTTTISPNTAIIGEDYGLIWLLNGEPIEGTDNLLEYTIIADNNDLCATQNQHYELLFTCLQSPTTIDTIPIGNVLIYPDYHPENVSIITNDCLVPELLVDCDNYIINNILPPPTTIEAGDTGMVNWQVTTLANCWVDTIQVIYECPLLCPIIAEHIDTTFSICENDSIAIATINSQLVISENEQNLANITWYAYPDFSGEPIDFSLPITANNICNATLKTYYGGAVCLQDSSLVAAGQFTVQVFPFSQTEGFVITDCAVNLVDEICGENNNWVTEYFDGENWVDSLVFGKVDTLLYRRYLAGANDDCIVPQEALINVDFCACVTPPNFTSLVDSLAICAGEINTQYFDFEIDNWLFINWYDSNDSLVAFNTLQYIPIVPDNYQIAVITNNYCDTIYASFTLFEVPIDSLMGNDITINLGDTTSLQIIGSNNLLWENHIDLSCLDCPTPQVAPMTTTTYTVSSTDLCMASTSITVFVEQDSTSYNNEVLIPSAFSPNQDGINDNFNLHFSIEPVGFYLAIYNRWGRLVYESKNATKAWDGFFQNQPQEIGVYVYWLQYQLPNQSKKMKQGNLTLLR